MTQRRLVALLGVAVTTAIGLTGCGTGQPPPAAPSGSSPVHDTHNPADVAFAQRLIPQLTQEADLGGLAQERAGSAQIKDLAQRMPDERRPWIDQMTGLLREWNAQVPDSSAPDAQFGKIPGMASDQEIRQLTDASGPAFDGQFTQLMIHHHQGAISLANNERSNGQSSRLKAIALEIVNAEQHEITELGAARANS
jgi:uncharacterized protein (DUF305 family)